MAQSKQPTVVVVGVDYSETGDLAFDRAIQLCQAEPNSSLHVVNVAPRLVADDLGHAPRLDPRTNPAEAAARLRDYVQKKLSDLGAQNRSVPGRIEAHLRWDAPGEEIAQLAADLEADLVVVGTHGRRGLRRVWMGSVAELVVRLAPCPVLVIRPKGVMQEIPAIEPACPECLKVRAESAGATLWCEQHSEHHGPRHTYHSRDRISADGTMPLLFHGTAAP